MSKSIVLQLQEAALNQDSKPVDLLRKALVVAAKLKISDFRNWIKCELDGYKPEDIEKDNLPNYRKTQGILKVINPYHGSQPAIINDPETEKILTACPIIQPISEIEHLATSSNLERHISGQMMSTLQNVFNCDLPFKMYIASNTMIKICDNVRNIILEWASNLEIQGIVGEGISFSEEEIGLAKNCPTVTIHNFSGVIGNVTTSEFRTVNQVANVVTNDIDSLKVFFSELGFSEKDINSLCNAIEADAKKNNFIHNKELGDNVKSWLVNVPKKLGTLALRVGQEVTADILTKAILKFYGF